MNGLDLLGNPILHRSAHFPEPGVRARLSRNWGAGPRALVIGCNPSDAGADREDMTTHWLNAWFQLFGFGGYDLMNLAPFVTPSPAECRKRYEAAFAGEWGDRDHLFANRDALATAAKAAGQVFVCWGAIAWDDQWIESVIEEIQTGTAPYPDLWCWGTTASGAPKHPMARGKHRIPRDQKPLLWRPA